MGKRTLLLGVVVALLIPAVARAQIVRAEVILLFDTSGSMASAGDPLPSGGIDCNDYGSDCLGARPGDVDICPDGMCTGYEDGSCSDCNLSWNNNPVSSGVSPAGQAPECGQVADPGPARSFLGMSKQVIRNLLPAFRLPARFALLTQHQSGYFRYFKGDSSEPTKRVSIFLTEWEMKNYSAWDGANDQPQGSFVWPGSGTSFLRVSDPSNGFTPAVTADALYYREDTIEVEKRFPWSGKTHLDGGHTWIYAGSYFTYEQLAIAPGDERQETLYRGPQFVDGSDTWVYGRWRYARCVVTQQGFSTSCNGDPLFWVKFNPSTDQAAQDATLGEILAYANKTPNGGMIATGTTPLAPAMGLAKDHFIDRIEGTGPFAAVGPDPYIRCRKRLVILISDGTLSCSNSTESALAAHAKTLFDYDTVNPIKTYAIVLPGGQVTALDEVATEGGTVAPLYAANQKQLIAQMMNVLITEIDPDSTVPLCPPAPCINGACAPGFDCVGGLCVPIQPDAGMLLDMGTPDVGLPDTGAPVDSAAVDAALADSSVIDSGMVDSQAGDASAGDMFSDLPVSTFEAGTTEGGVSDLAMVDAATFDAVTSDAVTSDFSTGDGQAVDLASAADGQAVDQSALKDGQPDSRQSLPRVDDGCNCAVSQRSSPLWPALLLALLAFAFHRRRRFGHRV